MTYIYIIYHYYYNVFVASIGLVVYTGLHNQMQLVFNPVRPELQVDGFFLIIRQT